MRPDDVPTWKESTKLSFQFCLDMWWTIPLATVAGYYLPRLLLIDTASPADVSAVDQVSNSMLWVMPLGMLVMLCLIFLLGIFQERNCPTPKEIEAAERRQLQRLKTKYEDVDG